MSDSEAHLDLAQVLERFPREVARIRQLASLNENFWSICEDYALARAALAKLQETATDGRDAGKVAEYQSLVEELEQEVIEALRNEPDD